MTKPDSNIKGIGFLILALLIISLQSVGVKWIGGSYPVLEMVVLRNLVALLFTLRLLSLRNSEMLEVQA